MSFQRFAFLVYGTVSQVGTCLIMAPIDFRSHNRREMQRFIFSGFCFAIFFAGSCVHSVQPRVTSDAQTRARLDRYELSFARFIEVNLNVDDMGEDRHPLLGIEAERAKLQSLRLRYLRVLSEGSSDALRARAMVRIAELHLDLAARIRRAEYPKDKGSESKAEFDGLLAQKAAPLEAVGLGVLRQLQHDIAHRESTAAYLKRASLYLVLHQNDAPLTALDRASLQKELRDRGPGAAPLRLLSRGRLGLRSARARP